MKIVIRIPVKPGHEDEIPRNLPRRISLIIENAFLELIDGGIIDIRTSVTGIKPKVTYRK